MVRDQLPPVVLKWLLASQLLILLPLSVKIPWWLCVVSVFVLLWRWRLNQGHWIYPGRWVKVLIALVVMAALLLTFRSFAVNAMVSLLVSGFTLKLLELKRRQDLYLLVFLGFFVVGTQLLFTSGLFGAFYATLCIACLCVTLLINNTESLLGKKPTPKKPVALMMLQSIPIMLVLFFLVPRLGSLWTVPLNSAQGTTGVSDTMSPGDIASLAQSDETAFRVSFNGAIPELGQLYWRGLILDYFEGKTWKQSNISDVRARQHVKWRDWQANIRVEGESLEYSVMLEPTDKNWLYSLGAPTEIDENIWVSNGFTLYQKNPVSQRKQYSLTTHIDYALQPDSLPEMAERMALQLPRTGNPETRLLAKQWMQEEGSAQQLIERFLAHIRDNFYYTLQPPTLGRDSIDEFLMESKSGFCGHFAGSFVFFMRAAGVPARMVVGYQGGRLNPIERYFTVRQLDAHAWAEVWIRGRGWVRVDPTFAVAPERIERGVEYSLDSADYELIGNNLGSRFEFWNRLHLRIDAFNYRWHLWVMDYDSVKQEALMRKLFGQAPPWRIALQVVLAIGAIVMLWLIPVLWRSRPQPRSVDDKALLKVSRLLGRSGYIRESGETLAMLAERISKTDVELARLVLQVAKLYESSQYASQPVRSADYRKILRQIASY